MTPERLAPLLAWVASKYAEELDARFLDTPLDELWGRHVIWLFLLTNPGDVDPRDGAAVAAFLEQLPDDLMAPARAAFYRVIEERRPAG